VICHLVFYRMKRGKTPADENRLVEEARNRLSKLRGVKNLRAGTSITGAVEGYSAALVMEFADRAELEAYRLDADHQRFVKEVAEPLVEEIWRFDFEG
jgi:Stress responsive A/B Barrel Domain